MKFAKRAAIGAAIACVTAGRAWAQPARGVSRLVVPYPPGGGTDTLARLVTPRMSEGLGQTWIVENRSGASGVVGGDYVARSAPDGQTLMISPALHLMVRHVVKAVTYDPYQDFTPIARVAEEPYVLIANARTIRQGDLASLLAALKNDPGEFPFANPAMGSISHLVTASLGLRLGVQPVMVAYRGAGPALNDMVSGTVALMVAPLASAREFVRSGQVKALAVTTQERLPSLSDVPTMAESGLPELSMVDWLGIWGPKGISEELRNRLASTIRAAVAHPDVSMKITGLGLRPVSEPLAAFDALLAEVKARDERIASDIGIRPE